MTNSPHVITPPLGKNNPFAYIFFFIAVTFVQFKIVCKVIGIYHLVGFYFSFNVAHYTKALQYLLKHTHTHTQTLGR